MKKLKLDVDALVVDSFTTRGSAALVGTVAGQEITQNCGGTAYCTLGSSCNGSCYASCGDPNCGTYYCTGDSCNQTCGGDCSNSCDAA